MQLNANSLVANLMNLKLFGLSLIISAIGSCGDDPKDNALSDGASGGDADTDTDTDADTDTDTDTVTDSDTGIERGTETDSDHEGTETDMVEATLCGAGTTKPACECGDIVGGNFTFTSNLICPTGIGLTIGADDVVVDGADYLLDGSSATGCIAYSFPEYDHIGIYNDGYDDVKIKNLEIISFCKGIFITGLPNGIDPADNNLIENNRIHGCGDNTVETNDNGIVLKSSVINTLVQGNVIYDIDGLGEACTSGGNAFYMEGPDTDYNTITQNVFYDNRKDGFMMKMKPDHNTISYNESYGNGRGGIVLRCKMSNDNSIENNFVHDNGGDGIFIGGSRNLVQHNTILDNRGDMILNPTDIVGDGDGIDIGRNDGSRDNEIKENEICGNEGTGIDVIDETFGNFGDDNACAVTNNYDDEGTVGCTASCDES